MSTGYSRLLLSLLLVLAAPILWAQGPPYQTDDPVLPYSDHFDENRRLVSNSLEKMGVMPTTSVGARHPGGSVLFQF